MRNSDYHNEALSVAATVLAAMAALPCSAQTVNGPFAVYRASNAGLVVTTAAHAQALAAPFDDDAGTLSDGQNYFYIVRNGSGAAVELSVHRNGALDAVRLGFDDGGPLPPGLDPSASSVTPSAASLPADGATMVIVTVLPVDTDGVLMGAGLDLAVDAALLLPGLVPQPVTDHGDGSYSFAVLSSVAGSGTVVVSVGGTTLASQPVLTFDAVPSPYCGDGTVDTGNFESCDDGNAADDDACLNSCETASCGDGFVWSGVEPCDDGNAADDDACLNSCETASCGDGFVWSGVESCDDGNAADGDACLNSCETASCGDGFVWSGVESCDDGNASEDDACRSTCEAAVCGDGIVWTGVEQCDGGPSCNLDCTPSSCGLDGSIDDCSAANALWVLILQFQALLDANPGAPYAAELQDIVDLLEDARDALLQPSPDPAAALDSIATAQHRLDDAVQAGLQASYAAQKWQDMRSIARQL